jgi:hypothetical protein
VTADTHHQHLSNFHLQFCHHQALYHMLDDFWFIVYIPRLA